MEEKNVYNGVKNGKLFRIADVILYIILAVFVLSLFIGFTFLPKKESKGFCIQIDGKDALYYLFDVKAVNKVYSFKDQCKVEGNSETGYTTLKDGSTNVIFIDTEENSARVVYSDCKSQTCVHSGKIYDNGVIICVPHGVKITPIHDEKMIIVGGGA
ncbi:MAG: NusG domain II-containing protein [Clostridia bacterium]|nr:NusG domain II-containing protein [Clostridia bacterium]